MKKTLSLLFAAALLASLAGCKDEKKITENPAAEKPAEKPVAEKTAAKPDAPAPDAAAPKADETQQRAAAYVERIRSELKDLYLALGNAIRNGAEAEFEELAQKLAPEPTRLPADALPLEKESAEFAARRVGESRAALAEAKRFRNELQSDAKYKNMQLELPGRKLGRFVALKNGEVVATLAGGKEQSFPLSNRQVARELALRAAKASGEPEAKFYFELLYGNPDDRLQAHAPEGLWRDTYPLISAELRKNEAAKTAKTTFYTYEDLDKMIANGQTAAFRQAATHGATLTGVDSSGRTLLMSAAREKNFELSEFLLKQKVPLEAVTIDGRTVLAIVVQTDDYKLVQLFLEHSANPNFVNPISGKRIIDLAPSPAIKGLLKAYGAKE